MRRAPRGISINQIEFEKFCIDFEEYGFYLNVNEISEDRNTDKIFSLFVDSIWDSFQDYMYYDKLTCQLLDYKNGFEDKLVYYKAHKIIDSEISEYLNMFYDNIDSLRKFIEKKIEDFLNLELKKQDA